MIQHSYSKTLLFVFGTRPELIKMAPLILEAKKNPSLRALACCTGQHKELLEPLFSFFDIRPDIDFNLMKPNQSLVTLHAEAMLNMNSVIDRYSPDWVIVQGDTTTAHAAAMTAFYKNIKLAHVEAGLRTYDINSPFPEEMNRRAISLAAKAHFCPTQKAYDNLVCESIDTSTFIEITGNTGIDALSLVAHKIKTNETLQNKLKQQFSFLNLNNFILATLHRRENFGSAQQEILKSFLQIIKNHNVDLLFPVHPNPNVRASVQSVFANEMNKTVFWINQNETRTPVSSAHGRIFLIEPLEYPALVYTMMNCRFVMTDSGGLQEEAPTFGKKILILRESTERPEGIKEGFSELVGTNADKIISSSEKLLNETVTWKDKKVPANPYGDGKASSRIIESLIKN